MTTTCRNQFLENDGYCNVCGKNHFAKIAKPKPVLTITTKRITNNTTTTGARLDRKNFVITTNNNRISEPMTFDKAVDGLCKLVYLYTTEGALIEKVNIGTYNVLHNDATEIEVLKIMEVLR